MNDKKIRTVEDKVLLGYQRSSKMPHSLLIKQST